jgi:site-specific DNA-methyltransferase (adenine-specific)
MKLFNCKFQDIIDTINYDIIITDPPYNIGFKYNEYKDKMPDDEYIKMMSLFRGKKAVIVDYPELTMKYLIPALGVPVKSAAWCYNFNYTWSPHCFRLINFFNVKPDFKKVVMPYKNPNDKRVKAMIEKGSMGAFSYDWFNDISLVKGNANEKSFHPCPIPERLVERILKMCTKEGDIVYDPFMGSGTVGRVCKMMKREFIGSESGSLYYRDAVNRIDEVII